MKTCAASVSHHVTRPKQRYPITRRAGCGALAEPGFDWCVVHMKARGYRRCEACSTWMPGVHAGPLLITWECPQGCKQPNVAGKVTP
jgi:hypothetical protein